MNEVWDFTFLKEMDLESLKESIKAANQQVKDKEIEVESLKESIEMMKQQVKAGEMDLELFKESIEVIKQQIKAKDPEQVKQQVRERDTLFTEEIEQFTRQCLRHLEVEEYRKRNAVGVSTAILYILYEIWCETQGIDCMSRIIFVKKMQSLGYYKDKGKCLVKSCAAGQTKDRQQIFFHIAPKIEDTLLKEQVREKLYEKLLECDWPQYSEEYQQPHALFVWFNKEDK